MKKLIFTLAVPALLFSCGGSDDYCGCAQEAADMLSEAGTDADKIKAAGEKSAECSAMLVGKSDAELEEIGKDCVDLMKK
tara:strand:- start:284 stop:523 length:240 start_codon:yes stop_codon:yes gene_type:complete